MNFRLPILILFTAFLCSCRTVDIQVAYNDKVDFFDYKTFDWLSEDKDNEESYITLKKQKIREAVKESLATRGLLHADNADLLVAVTIREREKIFMSPGFHHHYYHNYYWGYHTTWWDEPDYYTEYTLIIAMVDPKTKKALWEGSIVDWRFDNFSEEKVKQLINELLKRYPPVPSASVEEEK